MNPVKEHLATSLTGWSISEGAIFSAGGAIQNTAVDGSTSTRQIVACFEIKLTQWVFSVSEGRRVIKGLTGLKSTPGKIEVPRRLKKIEIFLMML